MEPIDLHEEGWENEFPVYTHEFLYVPTQNYFWYNDIKQHL
jgi:hypothetical protein